MLARIPFAIAALAACGPAAPARSDAPPPAFGGPPAKLRALGPSAGPTPSADARSGTRRAAIDYGRLPLPLVEVTVAGFPTSMVLDTGATRTVLGGWVVREAAVATRRSETLVADHTGRRVPVVEAIDPKLVIRGWGPTAVESGTGVLVAELPDVLERLGIGGLISPQRLPAGGEAVVVNLAGRELIAMEREEASRRYGGRGRALAARGAVHVCAASGSEAPLFVVDAGVGGQPALLELNTGAADSDLKDTSAAGKALATRALAGERTVTASGSFLSRTLGTLRLTAGEVDTAAEVLLVQDTPRPTCQRDGFLGMSTSAPACWSWMAPARS